MRAVKMVLVVVGMLALTITADAATARRHAKTRAKASADSALAAEAKVDMKTARATALAKVPGGKIQSEELERENGKLIYSFDIRVKGKSGIDEVNVDAMDGSVVGVSHESPTRERKEAREEKKTPTTAH